MSMKSQFYCVSCGEIMNLHESAKLFLTGFYRIEYPLGCCTACMKKLRAKEQSVQNLRRRDTNPADAPGGCLTDDANERLLVLI